ncbi:hypothetical protein Bca4012_042671 [Brassica carinata]
MGRYSYSQPSQSDTYGGGHSDSDSNEIEALIQEDQAQLELVNVQQTLMLRYGYALDYLAMLNSTF